jgi:phage tail tube protein FII
MALREINRYLTIAGCSLYDLDEAGQPGAFPISIDAEVTLPSVSFLTSDAQLMGNMSVPIQTSLENMEMTISLNDGKDAFKAFKKGVAGFMVRYATSITNRETGEVFLGGFTAKARGLIGGKEGLAVAPTNQSDSNLTLHLVSYQFQTDDNSIVINIDRPNGILEINGVDFREELRELL